MDYLQTLKKRLQRVENTLSTTPPPTDGNDFIQVYQWSRTAAQLERERDQLRQLIELEIATLKANY